MRHYELKTQTPAPISEREQADMQTPTIDIELEIKTRQSLSP